MAEKTLPSSSAEQLRPSWFGLSQVLVLGYLLAGLTALVSVPFLGLDWLHLNPLSTGSIQVFFNFPFFIGLLYLASGFWIFAVRRHLASGLAYAIFSTSIGLVVGLLFDALTTQRFILLWTLALAMSAGSLGGLALLFPHEDPLVARRPWLRWIFYAGALLLALFSLPGSPTADRPLGLYLGWLVSLVCLAAAFLFAALWVGLHRLRQAMAVEREQIRLIWSANLVSFGPIGLWLLARLVLPVEWATFNPYLLLPLLIFPAMAGYAIQRYRLNQTDFIFSRVVVYGLMAVLVSLGYALLVAGLSLVFNGTLGSDNPVFNGLAFFALAVLILPLRQRLENTIDTVFFRGQRAYQERLQTFSGDLTNLVDLSSILHTLRSSIEASLLPAAMHIFVYDPLSDQYTAAPDGQNRPSSDLRFSTASPLVTLLSQQKFPLFIGEAGRLPAGLQADQIRLNLLNAQLFAPLSGRQRLAGWLALGPRRSGEPYTTRELSFVDALCDQAALAIERAQVVINMENRVRETNVLARVAQGVNITLTLDDTLELIYAQATQVIPADDFHMILVNREDGQLTEVFYVVDDERFGQYENRPPIEGGTFEEEIIRLRRPVMTDDYNRECQKRGILSNRANIFGWMCVPLNAGAETIGTISLGKHDPTTPYTAEQYQLMQAIADQVAGSIVKVRLLQETEQRAHQLSTLNEVTRQLTSTLELEPLLNNILRSAVDILNCEAGSLLLVEDGSGDLVFRATAGPVANNLLNTHLPPGTGLVGKAVNDAAPLIVNNVQNTTAWFKQTDRQTGFVTHSVLVIPLMVKGKVTGVIEVINKKDGSSFALNDQELLSTFAAQASVAVENARLFTVTDQALTARVEELSVMQRIDRELNTSLDVATTMKITLEWAMRQSGAAAGLIGQLEESGLRIMASQGYTVELEPYQSTPLPLNESNFQVVIESGAPQRFNLDKSPGLLAQADSRVILPIRRETAIIGLVLIENLANQALSDDNLGFLQQLCDHASVAISNAQYYAAIQAANVAKSEFVSFVAHELKNPMTSIKGYTELLAAGAVGQVNEAQANFLSTIRSNIERMNTLVSDLNDLSKIEAGRLRMDFKALPLSTAVEDIVRSTRRQVEEKGQQLSIQLPTDLPNVWADRTRLAQILVNLVNNANKYTPQGGQVVVSAEACDNQWNPDGAPRVVHIWVKDNGIGIGPEDQKKIFQKFFRSEDPKTREAPGTGLGLNITKSLVEMQGGQIWFDSEFRKGTTFHFTIPVAE
jgi:signal transduction histidine kinase/putative methionine-R-sulfoxide reductase with GAF domain